MALLNTSDKTTTDNSTKKTPFIDAMSAMNAYDESRRWLRIYHDPLDEFERLARNRPSDRIDPSLPRVTDGTLAAIVQEQPKRIIQQLPTGSVNCRMYPEYAAVADVILAKKLIPMYNRMGDHLQKSWNMVGKAMTYGAAASYTFYTSTNGQMHTDYVIPYVKDVLSEKGKVYAPDSNVSFMRSWYQKRDLMAIITSEKAQMARDKHYTSDWDLVELAKFMDNGSSAKPSDLQTPAEKEKGGDNGGYEVIHAFQVGIGAESYSFSPRYESGKNLRTKINKDPRGHMPLDWLYCNIDLSNPLGRGQVELSGGVQNLIDQQMQMFQFMSTLEMGPPLQVWGNVKKSSLKFRPNAIWDMGSNGTNKVEPYVGSTTAMSNFSNNYSLLKSQILNLNSAQDHSVSATAGNIGQSKTSQGVQAQEQRLGVSDNYLRKQYENWNARQAETSLNIFFAEQIGKDSVEIGPLELSALKSSPADKFVKGDRLEVNYDDITNVIFNFQVDPSSSKESDDVAQIEKIDEILKEVGENGLVLNYYLGQDGKKLNIGELYKQRFERLGLKNIGTILTDMTPEEAQQAKQSPFPVIDKPQIRINTADLTAEQIAAALQAGGIQTQPQQPDQQQPGIPPGLSPQGIADFMVEMTKAQAAIGSGQPTGMNPDELALKHRELDIKAHDSVAKSHQAMMTHDQQGQQMAVQVQQADQQQQLAQQQADTQAQQAQAAPQEAEGTKTDTPQPGEQEPTVPLHGLTAQEQQIVETLLHRGFSEQDAEQAIVMIRKGMPIEQVIQTLGAKQR